MQIFLPYKNFVTSAKMLDDRRLAQQRLDIIEVLNTLANGDGKYINHPVVKAWAGYEDVLAIYGMFVSNEYRSRGFEDELLDVFCTLVDELCGGDLYMPSWLGDEEFHSKHRKVLLKARPAYYARLFEAEDNAQEEARKARETIKASGNW